MMRMNASKSLNRAKKVQLNTLKKIIRWFESQGLSNATIKMEVSPLYQENIDYFIKRGYDCLYDGQETLKVSWGEGKKQNGDLVKVEKLAQIKAATIQYQEENSLQELLDSVQELVFILEEEFLDDSSDDTSSDNYDLPSADGL